MNLYCIFIFSGPTIWKYPHFWGALVIYYCPVVTLLKTAVHHYIQPPESNTTTLFHSKPHGKCSWITQLNSGNGYTRPKSLLFSSLDSCPKSTLKSYHCYSSNPLWTHTDDVSVGCRFRCACIVCMKQNHSFHRFISGLQHLSIIQYAVNVRRGVKNTHIFFPYCTRLLLDVPTSLKVSHPRNALCSQYV